jgi:hypothetical protein
MFKEGDFCFADPQYNTRQITYALFRYARET